MASRRLLSKAFEGRHLFCKAHNALHGNGFAQFVETVEFRRFDSCFLQRRAVVIASQSYLRQSVIYGHRWREELKNLNKPVKECLRLDPGHPKEGETPPEEGRRLLRLVRKDSLMKRLRQIPYTSISRKELYQICMESEGEENAKEAVKSLDETGQILIVGDCVYLRPEQVSRIMENILPLLNDSPREELKEMERQKAEIDVVAQKIVRKELWCGLGFMSLQTAYLMQLTFWELSWDVMEPICFFLTSIYFLAGYAFFLRTSADPTFEGFFQARFETRRKRLMKKRNFDIERFKELRMIAGSPMKPQSASGSLFQAI